MEENFKQASIIGKKFGSLKSKSGGDISNFLSGCYLRSLKKIGFSWIPRKGSVHVKKLPNELNCPKKGLRKSTKPKKVLPLDTRENLRHETFFSFVQNLKKIRRNKPKPWGSVVSSAGFAQTSEVWFFLRNYFRFCGEGSSCISRGITFSSFADSFIGSSNSLTHLEAFWHRRNFFEGSGKNLFF